MSNHPFFRNQNGLMNWENQIVINKLNSVFKLKLKLAKYARNFRTSSEVCIYILAWPRKSNLIDKYITIIIKKNNYN